MIPVCQSEVAADDLPIRRFDLYVAGDTLLSHRAIDNLYKIVASIEQPIGIRVIDVMQEPRAALERGIFATPSLLITDGKHSHLIIGDLGDQAAALAISTMIS